MKLCGSSYLTYLRKTLPCSSKECGGKYHLAPSGIGEGCLASCWLQETGLLWCCQGGCRGENHEENISVLLLEKLGICISPLFLQLSTHYGNFVIFLDSEGAWLLARGKATQRDQIKMTTKAHVTYIGNQRRRKNFWRYFGSSLLVVGCWCRHWGREKMVGGDLCSCLRVPHL